MNVPELRFPEFSGEWEEKELGDIIEILNSKYNPNKNNETYKCIELEHLSKETGQLLGYCNSKEQCSIKNKFKEGNILFGKLRPYLRKFWLAQFDGVCSSEIWVLNGKTVSNNFLFNLIQTNKFNYISNISSGSKMPRSDWKFMNKIKFKIPSLPEQEKISSFLLKIDKKIKKIENKEELWQKYKKGMIQQLFSQELRFKDKDGNDFPKWEEEKLGNLIEDIIDNRGKTPPISQTGIPLIEISSIGSMNVDYTKVEKYVSEEIYRTWFRKYLKEGDVLFSTVGQYAGLCSLYQDSTVAVVAQNIVGLRFSEVNSIFMYFLLTETQNNRYIKSIEMSAAQPSIKVTQLTGLHFKIPAIREQQKIANFLSAIDKKIENINKELEIIREFKKGLLQQILTSDEKFAGFENREFSKLKCKNPEKSIL